jgi:hypothetical protein
MEAPKHVGVQEALAFVGFQMRGDLPPPQPKEVAFPAPPVSVASDKEVSHWLSYGIS